MQQASIASQASGHKEKKRPTEKRRERHKGDSILRLHPGHQWHHTQHILTKHQDQVYNRQGEHSEAISKSHTTPDPTDRDHRTDSAPNMNTGEERITVRGQHKEGRPQPSYTPPRGGPQRDLLS